MMIVASDDHIGVIKQCIVMVLQTRKGDVVGKTPRLLIQKLVEKYVAEGRSNFICNIFCTCRDYSVCYNCCLKAHNNEVRNDSCCSIFIIKCLHNYTYVINYVTTKFFVELLQRILP